MSLITLGGPAVRVVAGLRLNDRVKLETCSESRDQNLLIGLAIKARPPPQNRVS